MTITITQIELKTGVALTPYGSRMRLPWADSPDFETAAERATAPVLTRVGDAVHLQWSPSSGATAQATLSIQVEAHCPVYVTEYKIDWGDGTPVEVVPGLGVKNRIFSKSHVYLNDSVLITVDAYQGAVLVDSGSLVVSFARSSDYEVQQYRVERFKGRIGYCEPGQLWFPDWQEYTGAVGEMNYYDYTALPGWNWGYRLWLRSVDSQGLPYLTMVPSAWAQTGSGEGYVSGWGSLWGSVWGSA